MSTIRWMCRPLGSENGRESPHDGGGPGALGAGRGRGSRRPAPPRSHGRDRVRDPGLPAGSAPGRTGTARRLAAPSRRALLELGRRQSEPHRGAVPPPGHRRLRADPRRLPRLLVGEGLGPLGAESRAAPRVLGRDGVPAPGGHHQPDRPGGEPGRRGQIGPAHGEPGRCARLGDAGAVPADRLQGENLPGRSRPAALSADGRHRGRRVRVGGGPESPGLGGPVEPRHRRFRPGRSPFPGHGPGAPPRGGRGGRGPASADPPLRHRRPDQPRRPVHVGRLAPEVRGDHPVGGGRTVGTTP